jgi:hypothetical protein
MNMRSNAPSLPTGSPTAKEKPVPVTTYAMSLLLSWLQIHGGCDVQAWTFDREELEAIPSGYYAVVRVELRKLDSVPKEVNDTA